MNRSFYEGKVSTRVLPENPHSVKKMAPIKRRCISILMGSMRRLDAVAESD